MTYEVIGLIANLALALSLIVAVVFGIVEVRTAARDRRERLTLETLRNIQTREFAELIYRVTLRDMPKTREELYASPANDQILFIQFAQEMESLGLLVAEGFINIDLVDKTLGSLVTTSWEKYKNVFLDIREKQPDPFLGEYFQWLAAQIDRRLRDNPRKPFHEVSSSSSTVK